MAENMLDSPSICTCQSLLPGILGERFIYHTVILLSSIHSILDPWLGSPEPALLKKFKCPFTVMGTPKSYRISNSAHCIF